ncbi:hypothetical protein JCM10207_003151 [Rhodosporidiobolus poonsookiae]
MALSPKTATVFLIDCSASMGKQRTFDIGGHREQRTGLDVAKQYVKAKIVQRIMRELKTTPFSVILFGHPKTKNLLTTRAKEKAAENDEKFDRANDPYQHCYELLPFTFSADKSLLERVDEAVAGQGPDGDAFSALILGIESLDAQANTNKYPHKELVLITDGEAEIDWDNVEGAAKQMNITDMSLTVIGMDFDDEDANFVEEDKSDIKRTNEEIFAQLVDSLDQPSLVANARRAVTAITTPQLKVTNSRADRMILKLGNPEAHPDSALSMWVEVKKAIVPAAAPTMKKMSMRGFERTRQAAASQSQSQSQARGKKRAAEADAEETDEDDEDNLKRMARFAEQQNRERRVQMNAGEDVAMGKIGTTFDKTLNDAGLRVGDEEDADLAAHNVVVERRFFYRPPEKAKDPKETAEVKVKQKPRAGGETDEDEDEAALAEEAEADEWREAIEVELTDAFHYGGSLVSVGDLEDDAGTLGGLATGMEIVHFMKESDLRFEWRMGDVFYVYASPGQLGSEKLFSSLLNAMVEKRSVAVVRFVKKGFNSSKLGRVKMPDPQLGVLYPHVTAEGIEYCYWVRMPYAEDVRNLNFPSLDRLFNRKGERIHEHRNLPTQAQEAAMDALVDSMDLTSAGPPDEDGNPTEWFTVDDSYSPAIHNIQNTLVFRLANGEGDLPHVPRVLTQYMDPPSSVVEQSDQARQAVIGAFDIKPVLPKPKAQNKRTANYAQVDEGDVDVTTLLNTQNPVKTSPSQRARSKRRPEPMDVDEAGPEPIASKEDEDDFVVVDKEDANGAEQDAELDADDAEPDTDEEEPATEDEADGPGVSQPSNPASAVDEAFKLVQASFSHSKYKAAVEVLLTAGETASKSNSSAAFNAALRSFVTKVRSQPKKVDFLGHMQTGGVGLVGVSQDEAEQFSAELA